MEVLAHDDFMRMCVLLDDSCEGAIQWHHHHFGHGTGTRSDEPYTILPVCEHHHGRVHLYSVRIILDDAVLRRKVALGYAHSA